LFPFIKQERKLRDRYLGLTLLVVTTTDLAFCTKITHIVQTHSFIFYAAEYYVTQNANMQTLTFIINRYLRHFRL